MDKKEKQREKFKNAILYFVRYCNTKDLGATKLNKLMYYLDFLHYRDFKVSVTGAECPTHIGSSVLLFPLLPLTLELSLKVKNLWSITNYCI